MTPRGDLQAPDLYIPLMAFVTFILAVGCVQGAYSDSFDFEQLAVVYSKCCFLWLLETCCQKGLFYFLNIGNPPFFELAAYSGYKFVVLCPIAISEVLVGYAGSYLILAVWGSLFALFFY